MSNLFKFSKSDHIENHVFDPTLEKFRLAIESGEASGATIREILQNSMDANDDNKNEPVHVAFKIGEIERKNLPGIDQVFEHIDSLIPQNEYTEETVKHMKALRDKNTVTVLTAEDSNTKGLEGGNTKNSSSIFHTFAYNKGKHNFEDDSQKESRRGGSHGVGKIATNAASDIHLMYFANCDENNNQHVGGSVQLFDHQLDNSNYRGVGYFTDEDSYKNRVPYPNTFPHKIFSKETRGLKIIIPYLRRGLLSEEDMVKAVINNFFVSIIENLLTVTIQIQDEKIDINSETINDILKNPKYYEQDLNELRNEFTPLYVNTYSNSEAQDFIIKLKNQDLRFKLYFDDSLETIKKGRTAIVRSLGMKIEDFKVLNRATRPYNAVLIGGPLEDEFLKTLENESHTELSIEGIRDPEKQDEAKKFLSALDKKLAKIIDESTIRKIKSDGKLDTSEILYRSTKSFTQSIEKNTSTVEIENETSLTKKREQRHPTGNSSRGKGKPKPRKRKRKPRKLHPNTETGKQTILLPPDIVNRVIIRDEEYLTFDLNNITETDGWNTCNISFKIVNGDGKEYDDEVNLAREYENVININTSESYNINSNEIKNVEIVNNIVLLKFTLTDTHNSKLKYIYKLEVAHDL